MDLPANKISLRKSVVFFSDGLTHREKQAPDVVSLSAVLGEYILRGRKILK